MCNLSEQTIYGQVVQNGAVARAFSEQYIWAAHSQTPRYGYTLRPNLVLVIFFRKHIT